MKKSETLCLYAVGGDVARYSGCGKQYGQLLKTLKTESPCDPAIPLWVETQRNQKQGLKRYLCTMFTAAKRWKQMDKWITKNDLYTK